MFILTSSRTTATLKPLSHVYGNQYLSPSIYVKFKKKRFVN